MTAAGANALLISAMALSQAMFAASERGDFDTVAALDAERLQLLKSFRVDHRHVLAADRALLREIAQFNDRTIGMLEHRRRSKGREMDMAVVGRRALAAYSSTR